MTKGLNRKAKVLSDNQLRAVLNHVTAGRYPIRDRLLILLSHRQGLRAKEMAGITKAMVTASDGALSDSIELPNMASKGRTGGRSIPLHPETREALRAMLDALPDMRPDDHLIRSERADKPHGGMARQSIVNWFRSTYAALGYEGASSHSGRRSFITRAARKINQAGGSLRDVQELAGHASLSTTQGYIDSSADAKQKVVGML